MTEQNGNVTVMGIEFTNTTLEGFMESTVRPCLAQDGKCFIVTANPEIVIATRDHPDFKETVQSADHVLPDGIGIINAAKMMGTPLKERVSGFDVSQAMLDYAAQNGYRVFFLGASEDSNEKAVQNAMEKYPGLIVAGRQDGYTDVFSEDKVAEVVRSKPDIILVALGMIRQESWINAYIDRFDKGIFIGVGGTFDVMSGNIRRAPDRWIRLQLEWLYRLIQEPRRITRVLKTAQFMMMHLPIVNRIRRLFTSNKNKA
ncbi:WecB/TagA/CpsF family glycosyltransferase [Salinicoccus roseus]|uniref:WecB/TagA/CpsF family glycosyltransferase n=1 Tax=Salinicoccus roseus TaxID=45670 RepID=UPI003DA06D2A